MSSCADMRRGLASLSERNVRLLNLLRDIDIVLDLPICDASGIDRLVKLRKRIRAEIGP